MKRKIGFLLIPLSILLFITGCTSKETNSQNKKEFIFGASFNTMNNPHWIKWSEGLTKVVKNKGDKLIIMDAQDNISKQVSDVEDLVTQQVDAIFIAPADSQGIKPALEAAQKAKIPVIIMDVPVKDKNLVKATIATDNYLAGQLLAKAMIKQMNGHAKIGIIDYSTVNAVVERTNGFLGEIKKNPNMKVVSRQEGLGTNELGMKVMESFLQSDPDMNAVFAVNDLSGLGASAAIKAANRNDIKVFGIDGSEDGFKAIKNGELIGTSAQFPYKMGTIAAKTAYKIILKEKYERVTKVPAVWVDKSNVEKYLKN
ncbi:sugar ABC transporter substrate-binding protein [Priestia megaterium]|uniref:sugar ABC transporter substrate-binding protein n=1 Tax=Priestia megaterium TaxID=1404 RepID=UPI003A80CCE2